MTGSAMIGGYATGLPVQIPMIDIQEVGTGGGSIARVEPRRAACRAGKRGRRSGPGVLRPRRQGADRHRRQSGAGAAGRRPLSRRRDASSTSKAPRARSRAGRAAARHRSHAAADGILRIATITMSHVVRWVTTERGLDAADFTLIAYGGAGPLHAAMIARELRIAKVIIPRAPGHFSAYGMLVADLRRDFVVTWFKPLATSSFEEMEAIYPSMEQRGRAAIAAAGSRSTTSRCSAPRTCAMSARSTRSRSSCRSICSAARIATASSGISSRARDALRLFGAGREGRDRQPAQRRQRRDAQAGVRAHRRGRRRAAGRGRAAAAGLFRRSRRLVDTPTFSAPELLGGNASPGRR